MQSWSQPNKNMLFFVSFKNPTLQLQIVLELWLKVAEKQNNLYGKVKCFMNYRFFVYFILLEVSLPFRIMQKKYGYRQSLDLFGILGSHTVKKISDRSRVYTGCPDFPVNSRETSRQFTGRIPPCQGISKKGTTILVFPDFHFGIEI